jgi:DNA-binding Lrp family transcriptional regulator
MLVIIIYICGINMSIIDNIDRQLISLLRTDARTPITILAKKINVSRATIQNRMSKLEKKGVITGYTALVSSGTNEKMSLVRAHMSIELKGASTNKVKFSLMSEPTICTIHSTNGHWDMIVEIQAESLEGLDKVLGRIRNIPEISTSETSILLATQRIRSE